MSDGRDSNGYDETAPAGEPTPREQSGPNETMEFAAQEWPLPQEAMGIEAKLTADGYDVIAELGRGGMGVVYKGEERDLKRTVAIKLLSPAIASNPVAAKRFRREAILAANLNHPSIVPVFHIDSADPPQYYTMEFVAGRNLKEVIEADGPMDPESVLFIAQAALGALQHAHQRNIVHRDIKPANIILDEENRRVRVTDFGIAQDVTGTLAEVTMTGENTSVGTPAFMSPEQNNGEGLDARSDIFSLGATLYYALTAQQPFRAKNRQQLAAAFLSQVPANPRTVNRASPEWLDGVVLKMLSPHVEQRYQSCQAVLADLPSGAVARAPRRRRSWGKLVGSLVIVLIFALAVAGAFFGSRLGKKADDSSDEPTPGLVSSDPTPSSDNGESVTEDPTPDGPDTPAGPDEVVETDVAVEADVPVGPDEAIETDVAVVTDTPVGPDEASTDPVGPVADADITPTVDSGDPADRDRVISSWTEATAARSDQPTDTPVTVAPGTNEAIRRMWTQAIAEHLAGR